MQDAAERICGTHLDAFLVHDPISGDPRVEFDNWGEEDVSAWTDGEVYGVVIAPADTLDAWTDQLASCYGFYGYQWATESARAMLHDAELAYLSSAAWVTI
jgi:hypothetical protein